MPLRFITDAPAAVEPAPRRGHLTWVGQAWLVGPRAPRTVVADRPRTLRLRAAPGGEATARLLVENHQRAAALVRLMASPLATETSGRRPPVAAAVPPSLLLRGGERAEVTLRVAVPADTPTGVYRGSLVPLGCHGHRVPLEVEVAADG